MKRFHSGLTLALAVLVLDACARKEFILPGERFDVRAGIEQAEEALAPTPIRLSAQVDHTSWTHRAGSASHTIQHPALAPDPALIWSTRIGDGFDRKHRIVADPVASDGRIFTLDSRATVVATSSSGAVIWSRDLTPSTDSKDDASGGGLAVSGSDLYVTTGFGELFSLNVADGTENWRQKLDAAAAGAPSIRDGLIYLATRDSRAWAIEADTGRVRWQLSGAPSGPGIVGGAGPAIGNKLAVFPMGAAELVAALPKGGLRVWGGSVSGARLGRAYANIAEITGDPVIVGDVIYAGNPSGRTVALDATTGERIWTIQEGSVSPVWVDGGSVFLVSDQGQLMRLNAATGAKIWVSDMPNLIPKRRKKRVRDIYAHYGPVLAGGVLWVASNDGLLRGFNPADGAQTREISFPDGAATRPIIVNRVLYVVSQEGNLLAFR